MFNSINIVDQDYIQWIKDLSNRYRRSQIKAAVKVNEEMLRFYWELGKDIVEMHIEERWGKKVIKTISTDLRQENPELSGLSGRSIYYCKDFYLLYNQYNAISPQVVAKNSGEGKKDVTTPPSGCSSVKRKTVYKLNMPWNQARNQ